METTIVLYKVQGLGFIGVILLLNAARACSELGGRIT